MEILFGAHCIRYPMSGIGRYAYRLGLELEKHSDLKLSYFSGTGIIERPDPLREPVASVSRNTLKRFIPFKYHVRRLYHRWKDLRAQAEFARLQGEYLFHEPNYILESYQGPSIITVHDLSHIHYPECHPEDRIRFFNEHLPKSIERACHILTVSDFVREELIGLLGIAADKVTTTHNGVDESYHPRDESQSREVLARYGLTYQRYLLVVGTVEPRKNLRRLINAYLMLPKALQQAYPLLLVGGRGWESPEFYAQLDRLQAAGSLIWPGYVPEADLPVLYAGAKALAFPSIYEGFGLPVLEAMASGVPVLAAQRSAPAEILGDAGMLVDTLDEQAMADGLQRMLEDEQWVLQARASGLLRARQFSWQACAEVTAGVYRRQWQRFF
ncbi:glycosyltransferase family 4 protein [Vogesella fluminis]|uniref:Glycosyltransferase WbpY n=1 Tax=Vogesella fluminis TaxID=1069161 RepID=A0ABQ3HBV3_9NEIS|nr:glycosyltransferase family 1 protein [Vogesella fluminis]GHD81120.1 glycosyltransferase WbpY [Vogesella fluminis]